LKDGENNHLELGGPQKGYPTHVGGFVGWGGLGWLSKKKEESRRPAAQRREGRGTCLEKSRQKKKVSKGAGGVSAMAGQQRGGGRFWFLLRGFEAL